MIFCSAVARISAVIKLDGLWLSSFSKLLLFADLSSCDVPVLPLFPEEPLLLILLLLLVPFPVPFLLRCCNSSFLITDMSSGKATSKSVLVSKFFNLNGLYLLFVNKLFKFFSALIINNRFTLFAKA
ncbi:unnamed protein product [Ambrosiozyma monospora]|uniref:Unnamed protein product n=1 Tax=Ambrosiozyma monospora TaxID=43982 RepID=A0ACB5U453_AMBMO|nr:unnamed protein product [Ambrosiozyma monospora]